MKKVTILYACVQNVLTRYSLEEVARDLPAFFLEKAKEYVHSKDQYTYLLARQLVREQLQRAGFPSELLSQIRYNTFDKPYLPTDFEFNISHSGDWVVCAAGQGLRLGIDIEKKRPVDVRDFEDLFSATEFEQILADTSLETFFDFWSKKESIIKADGRGMSLGLQRIVMQENQVHIKNESQKWYLFPLTLQPAYKTCLCTDTPSVRIQLSNFEFA